MVFTELINRKIALDLIPTERTGDKLVSKH
jgi:hypothetical protein